MPVSGRKGRSGRAPRLRHDRRGRTQRSRVLRRRPPRRGAAGRARDVRGRNDRTRGMIATIKAGFVYDLYLSDGSIVEGFPHWALLKAGDDVEVEREAVHVQRVLRVDTEHYVVYGPRELLH